MGVSGSRRVVDPFVSARLWLQPYFFQLVETLGSPKEVLRLGNDATKLCPGFGREACGLTF